MDNFNFEQNNNAFAICQSENMVESQSSYIEEMKRLEYLKKRSFNRSPLIFALIGLILSIFFGFGIVFAIPALIMGARRCLKSPSKPLRWAVVISILTIFLCVLYIFATGYAIAMGFFELVRT